MSQVFPPRKVSITDWWFYSDVEERTRLQVERFYREYEPTAISLSEVDIHNGTEIRLEP